LSFSILTSFQLLNNGAVEKQIFQRIIWELLGILLFEGCSVYRDPQNNYLMGAKK